MGREGEDSRGFYSTMFFRFYHAVRTMFDLAQRVDQLEREWEQAAIEHLDRIDSLNRLIKRLATRESRGPRDGGDDRAVPSGELQPPAPGLDRKQELRELARQRGVIR